MTNLEDILIADDRTLHHVTARGLITVVRDRRRLYAIEIAMSRHPATAKEFERHLSNAMMNGLLMCDLVELAGELRYRCDHACGFRCGHCIGCEMAEIYQSQAHLEFRAFDRRHKGIRHWRRLAKAITQADERSAVPESEDLIQEMVPFTGEKFRKQALKLQDDGRKFQMNIDGAWRGPGECGLDTRFSFDASWRHYRLLPDTPTEPQPVCRDCDGKEFMVGDTAVCVEGHLNDLIAGDSYKVQRILTDNRVAVEECRDMVWHCERFRLVDPRPQAKEHWTSPLAESEPLVPWSSVDDVPQSCFLRPKPGPLVREVVYSVTEYEPAGLNRRSWQSLFSAYEWSDSKGGPWRPCGKPAKEHNHADE